MKQRFIDTVRGVRRVRFTATTLVGYRLIPEKDLKVIAERPVRRHCVPTPGTRGVCLRRQTSGTQTPLATHVYAMLTNRETYI
jgi:hypothetical protein